jgi:hypothetical protein
MIAGITGIMASIRKSYSFIYAFLTFSLFSFLFSIFLIIYYAILLNYYHRYRSPLDPTADMSNGRARPRSGNQSFGLVGTNLALSCLSLIISLISYIVAKRAGKIGSHRKDYVNVNSEPKYPYYTIPGQHIN